MEQKNKACWNCANFTRYYCKGGYHFHKTKNGKCNLKGEIVDACALCERWRNTFALRSLRKKRTLQALDEILSDIAAIRQILEEEDEESKTHPHHVDI